jgi:hypothetical protein
VSSASVAISQHRDYVGRGNYCSLRFPSMNPENPSSPNACNSRPVLLRKQQISISQGNVAGRAGTPDNEGFS